MLSVQEKEIIQKLKESKEKGQKNAFKKLIYVTIICIFFIAVEVTGGILSNSLSIFSDALHMFSDFAGFAISMVSIVMSKSKPSKGLSYGYHRAEVLGALGSIVMIWVVIGVLVYEGIERIVNNDYDINVNIMLIVAIVGLICNVLMGLILHSVFILY
jgi:cation diffusion facilitator family transporter